MRTQSRRNFMIGAIALSLTSKPVFATGRVRLQVVVARTTAVSDLPLADLRQIFKGKPLALDGHTAVPFNHPPLTPDRITFDRLILHMDPDEVARYWVDQKIRSGSPPPRVAESVSLLLRVVARLPGAIAYVREGFSSAEVKVLTIDGHGIDDPNYPLIAG